VASKSGVTIDVAICQPFLRLGEQVVFTWTQLSVFALVREGLGACRTPLLGTIKLALHFLAEVQVLHSPWILSATISIATTDILFIAHVFPTLYTPLSVEICFEAGRTDFAILGTYRTDRRDFWAYAAWHFTRPAPLVGVAAGTIVARVAPDAFANASPRHLQAFLRVACCPRASSTASEVANWADRLISWLLSHGVWAGWQCVWSWGHCRHNCNHFSSSCCSFIFGTRSLLEYNH